MVDGERADHGDPIVVTERVMAMTRSSARPQAVAPDAAGCAVDRIRFLTAEAAVPPQVRPAILASWCRSRDLGVAADRVHVPYQRDPDVDTPLTRSAGPVLARLAQKLSGHAVSMILTDQAGTVLSRRTHDVELEHQLDRVLLAPGFSFAERFVGTNGIGTALEAGSATQVLGHEHYAEDLERFACAAVPIHHPMSGRMVGVFDLTCWRRDADTLLLTLAETTAEQIEQALHADAGLREVRVLQAYRQACRRGSEPVFAVTPDAVTLNDRARSELDAADQSAVIAHAAEVGAHLPAGRRRSIDVLLPSGSSVRLHCQQVDVDSDAVGLVVRVKPIEQRSVTVVSTVAAGALPGLVGDSPNWRQACARAREGLRVGEWLVVQGEVGVGKLALLRAILQPGRFTVIDAASEPDAAHALRAAVTEFDNVVLAHVDALDTAALRRLTDALRDARHDAARPRWIGMTVRSGVEANELGAVLAQFPRVVEVPPLRLRLDDVNTLVPHLLAQLSRGGRRTCSPEAMRVLLHGAWPGNVAQLRDVLARVARQRRAGPVEAADLPSELHSTSRRVLTPMESMERDAIVQALATASGRKVDAARALGISRATIYRKIHEYGIVSAG